MQVAAGNGEREAGRELPGGNALAEGTAERIGPVQGAHGGRPVRERTVGVPLGPWEDDGDGGRKDLGQGKVAASDREDGREVGAGDGHPSPLPGS